MRGAVLPPLSAPRTRILLLASSFDDAVLGSDDGGRGSKPGSRAQGHNPELWPYGSYREFQHAIEDLRQGPYRHYVKAFWTVYVEHGTRLVHGDGGRVIGYRKFKATRKPPKGAQIVKGERARILGYLDTKPFDLSTVVQADTVVSELVKLMGDTIFVPQVVAANAGYNESEAKHYERRRAA